MAIRIELWVDAVLVDGLEQWWDDVDGWMDSNDDRRARFPAAASIDPYGIAVILSDDFPAFIAELADIAAEAPTRVTAIATRLASLVNVGLAGRSAELRFIGD